MCLSSFFVWANELNHQINTSIFPQLFSMISIFIQICNFFKFKFLHLHIYLNYAIVCDCDTSEMERHCNCSARKGWPLCKRNEVFEGLCNAFRQCLMTFLAIDMQSKRNSPIINYIVDVDSSMYKSRRLHFIWKRQNSIVISTSVEFIHKCVTCCLSVFQCCFVETPLFLGEKLPKRINNYYINL